MIKKMGTVKVILDSNFLFIPAKFKLDIFEELNSLLGQKVEPIILSATYDELKKLSKSPSVKTSKLASLALKLAEKCKLVESDQTKSTDEAIISKAEELRCIVATNDREVLRKLKEKGIPRIYLRQKKKLVVEGLA